MLADEVLQCHGHLGFRGHWISSEKMRLDTTIQLEHGAATMARNAIIMGRCISKNGVCGKPFMKTPNIGSRKAGFKVLAEGVVHCGTVILGGTCKGLLDAFGWHPTKVWTQSIQIR